MPRVIVFALFLLLAARPAVAQLVVIDPGNLVQAVLIADRTLRHYEMLRAQYQTVQRLAQGLGNMEGYRVPPIGTTRHDTSRWAFGRPWLDGLNSGDPTGDAYWRTTRPLMPPGALLNRLPPHARRAVERAYATVEISDSVAQMGGHQIALVRGYSGRLQQAVQALEGDVMNGLLRYHELTAVLDKVAAGELLARRQDMAANQLLSHTLEQLLARGKRQRDTEAVTMNMRLVGLLQGQTVSASVIDGAGEDLRRWRQP